MPKGSLETLAAPIGVSAKGTAAPTILESRNQETKQEILEERNQGNNQERKKPWDGHDTWIKVNYEVPERVQMKLQHLKASRRIRNFREFVPAALEAALDAAIAQAEQEGY
jgi:hypothetical protein